MGPAPSATRSLRGLLFPWLGLLAGCAGPSSADRAPVRSASPPARSVAAPVRGDEERSSASGETRGATPELRDLLGTSDLEGLVALGLETNAELRAAREEWRAAGQRGAQEGALPEPRLSYVELLEEIQTRTGPQERRIGLSQSFPWPGELDARTRLADERAEVARHRLEAVRWRVRETIEVAYHDYAFLGRERDITERLLELLRGLEPVVQGRVRAGAGQEDLLRLQIEIGRLEDDLYSIERRRPAVAARLADALTRGGDLAALPFPELVEPRLQAGTDGDALERAHRTNPDLRAARGEHAARRVSSELADFRGKPTFTVGFDWLETGSALAPGTTGSGDDPLLLSLSVSLPVWGSSYDAAEREARHRLRAASERVARAESSVRAALEEQAYRVDDAARRIALYRDSLIPRAEEALQLTLTSYRSGAATVLDLIDSERALLEFELSYWRACRDHLQGTARLCAITGGEEA